MLTVPVPEPASEIVNGTPLPKLAEIVVLPLKTKLHVKEAPEHAPDQPANELALSGLAVRVMLVPTSKLALQACPQLMPEGLLVTVPAPGPVFMMVNRFLDAPNPADTVVGPFTKTLQLCDDPEHAPDQPVKVALPPGVAARVTVLPLVNVAVQVGPQLIPEGLLVTVPVPLMETLNCEVPAEVCGEV